MQMARALCVALSVFVLVSVLSVHATPGDPPPTAFLERATVVGVGKNVHITRVPTQDINGVVRYFDVEISLNVNDEGVVDTATVVSAESPQFSTNAFIAGNYEEVNGSQCTLTAGVALEGRSALAFNCVGEYNGSVISATWYTGPIAGHPFEIDLTAAGIDQIPGHENFSWGKVISGSGPYIAFGCFQTNQIIGLNQIGNVLTIANYGNSNLVHCGYNFTLVEP
jgi:hypothetical protein